MEGLILGLVLMLGGATELWLAWVGSQRRLPPNWWAGIRLRATRSSDQAWYAAHEAAAGPFGLGGGVASACGMAVVVNGLDVIGVGVAAVGLMALLAGAAWATVVALRAAGTVSAPTEGPDHAG